jgi:hypothetical protein
MAKVVRGSSISKTFPYDEFQHYYAHGTWPLRCYYCNTGLSSARVMTREGFFCEFCGHLNRVSLSGSNTITISRPSLPIFRLAILTVALIISLIATLVFFAINVGTSEMGGIVGTLKLPNTTKGEDIVHVSTHMGLVGFGWACISFLCFAKIVSLINYCRLVSGSYVNDDFNQPKFLLKLPKGGQRAPFVTLFGTLMFVTATVGLVYFGLYYGINSGEFLDHSTYFIKLFMASVTVALVTKGKW